MQEQPGGTYKVPCEMNGVKLNFIFDSGASDVSISLTEAQFMLKNGHMKIEDIIVSGHYGCGGIKAAFQNNDFGPLESWLSHIR